MDGKFIVFEGPDGSGKSTAIKKIKEKMLEEGKDILIFREPGGTEISEKIRNIIIDNDNVLMNAKTECLLFAASRAQLVYEKIRPALEAGSVVISDRFVLSSLLYQGIGRNLGVNQVKKINDFATGDIKPDLTIFFDIDYKSAMERKKKNFTLDRLENEEMSFHKKIFDAYMDLSNTYKDEIKRIDATQSIDEVAHSCLVLIEELLKEKI